MRLRRLRHRLGTLWTLAAARTPVYVILYLTARCNMRCPMCFYLDEIKDPDKEEMALPELEKIARSLKRLVQLSLTGGEPFLRQDIPQVVDMFARHNDVKYVTIPTNGSLSDRVVETVERLVVDHKDTHFRIPVSLDGFPEDHDEIRGARSFQKAEETLARLARLRRRVDNLTVDINTCYSALNQGKMDGFVDFVADRFDVDNHTITYVRGNADEETKKASAEEYIRLVEDLRRRRSPRESRPFSSFLRAVMDYQRDIIRWTLREDRMYVPCAAGKKMIVITERGEVLPCEILSGKLGNLKTHDYDLRKILDSTEARSLVKWIRESKCHCTFECALATSIIYHPVSYPRILWRGVKQWPSPRPSSAVAGETDPRTGPVVSLPVLGSRNCLRDSTSGLARRPEPPVASGPKRR